MYESAWVFYFNQLQKLNNMQTHSNTWTVKWHFNIVNLICLVLLSIITVTVLSSAMSKVEPSGVKPSSVESGRQDDEYYDTHPLTWHDMKEYQVDVVDNGNSLVFYDYNRVAFVVHLDRGCNLTKAIDRDNQ